METTEYHPIPADVEYLCFIGHSAGIPIWQRADGKVTWGPNMRAAFSQPEEKWSTLEEFESKHYPIREPKPF